MKGLIVGFGRAGQRHGRMLDEMGINYNPVDTLVNCDDWGNHMGFGNLEAALDYFYRVEDFPLLDFAIIATPPDLHLSQIRQCLDVGLPVLCEKPLCSLGQLDEARELLNHPNANKVMVAYNYRYHPALIAAVEQGLKPYLLYCQQKRELPAWGLLLDHVSHDLDIARIFYPEMEVDEAHHATNSNTDSWSIYGTMVIQETVDNYSDKRMARLSCHNQVSVDIDPDPAMYHNMLSAFLAGNYYPTLTEVVKTQELLERCWGLDNDNG